jgi:hypothetical protein
VQPEFAVADRLRIPPLAGLVSAVPQDQLAVAEAVAVAEAEAEAVAVAEAEAVTGPDAGNAYEAGGQGCVVVMAGN